MMGYGNAHELAWLWMLIPTALLFSAVAFGVWAAARTTNSHGRGEQQNAGSILEQRYAKGEISKADFDDARRTLGLA